MTQRSVLLVGSMPFRDESTAMAIALEELGDHLWAVPDGEIGERTDACPGGTRSAWVQTIMDRCEADTETWKVVRPARRNAAGYAADYRSGPRLEPRRRPRDIVEHLDFGWATAALDSYPEFCRLRDGANRPDLRFQIGLPTGLGATFGMMSPSNALRYAGAFNRRLALEANAILTHTEPGDAIIQIEVPGELAMAHRLPKPLVGLAVRSVVTLIEQIEPLAPIGVHLCFGDLNNEALISPAALDRTVHFANTLIGRWPAGHELAYVHAPLAEAAEPPPLERSYYEPLGGLRVPDGVRFVAGFVHPGRSDEEHRTILEHIESIRGETVDVASSCGLGRIDEAAALRAMRAARHLVV